jgi:hypothetical protein
MMQLSVRLTNLTNEELLVVNRRILTLVGTWPAISQREIIAGDASRGLIERDPSGNKAPRLTGRDRNLAGTLSAKQEGPRFLPLPSRVRVQYACVLHR